MCSRGLEVLTAGDLSGGLEVFTACGLSESLKVCDIKDSAASRQRSIKTAKRKDSNV
jgi:hypothetical protein